MGFLYDLYKLEDNSGNLLPASPSLTLENNSGRLSRCWQEARDAPLSISSFVTTSRILIRSNVNDGDQESVRNLVSCRWLVFPLTRARRANHGSRGIRSFSFYSLFITS